MLGVNRQFAVPIRLCRNMTQVNITRIAALACANMVFDFCLICILLNETKKLTSPSNWLTSFWLLFSEN
ncbi:hypothetical protein AMD00_16640 [Viridibacillus arvi]|uniref:Uncharacterized protein n=1 Tax=Viridibacillus arvi TaxID=263475 RepID=A0A0M0LFV0_9BACL|nr:hypothetical protein AMD00_16640 [Viridibacillus arvi]